MGQPNLTVVSGRLLLIFYTLLACLSTTRANGDRQPALFTQRFGDCMGGSLLDITHFDAAYYKDNMTVVFHLEGTSLVTGINLMMQIGVFAYGESRFNILFNPCQANMHSMCPTNKSIPVTAGGIIPVSEEDVAGIPPIALGIPDFEGQAMLRIFSNATESEIGCYSAVVTNGNTFSHPNVIGPIIAIFVVTATIASFFAATYEDNVTNMRTHYAHSISVLVVFSVLQHIYFSGALSVNWPSVLPAFWSNFAWAGGMIYSERMMNSINKLLGVNLGNTTVVGAAALGHSDNTGGGYQLSEVYKRSYGLSNHVFGRAPVKYSDLVDKAASIQRIPREVAKRAIENSTTSYSWYGVPVNLGLPLPGNYSGFAGTLSQSGIPASNAFLTGFLWFLIILALVMASVIAAKWTAELFVRLGMFKQNRLVLFRKHWLGFTAIAAARTFVVAFFIMIFLSLFQFVYEGSQGVFAVAACVFITFFLGLFGTAALACLYRMRVGEYGVAKDRVHLGRTYVFGKIPWYGLRREHLRKKESAPPSIASIPWWRLEDKSIQPQREIVHEDVAFVKRYGWLTARFRRTRWWFFTALLAYEFVRACFYGGAASHPKVQVYGLLGVEIVALVLLVWSRPFEGNRLNVLMVWLLGFSKVACTALSAAFISEYAIGRITAAAIGMIIVVIQGFLLLATIILIILGAISTRMSMTRNREVEPHAEDWAKLRQKYFAHLETARLDEKKTQPTAAPRTTTTDHSLSSRFSVHTIHRMPKIEDHDTQYEQPCSLANNDKKVRPNDYTRKMSQNDSIKSTMSYSNLPFGARPHRPSWSSREFQSFSESQHSLAHASPNASRLTLPNATSDASLRGGYQIQPIKRPVSGPPSRPHSRALEVRKSRTPNPMVGTQLKPIISAVEDEPKSAKKENAIGLAQ